MSRFPLALRLEITLQWRYRFLQAGVFSGLLWLAMLLPMPAHLRSTAEPYVTIGDLAIVGYFFMAGSVFFEKGERTLHALVATPLRFGEYLGSKLVTLTALSTLLAVTVATVTHGLGYDLPALVLGASLGTLLMLLAGFASALPFRSVSDWYFPATVPLAVLSAPVVHYSGVWETPWMYLVPTQGPLLLLGAAFDQKTLSWWQLGYSVGYPLLFAAGLGWVARRLFARYVVARTGGA